MHNEVIKLQNVFPWLPLIFPFPMACCCAPTELPRSGSFPGLRGADVQTSAARRTEHLRTGQDPAQLTPLGGKEQEVTGSHRQVSVSTYDLTSLEKNF